MSLTDDQIAELARLDGDQRAEMTALLLRQANDREALAERHQVARLAIAKRFGVDLQAGITENELPGRGGVIPASRTPAARPGNGRGVAR